MKVISETVNRGVLVQITAEEFYQLTGKSTRTYHDGFNKDVLDKTFDLKEVFERVRQLPDLLNGITSAQIKLRQCADAIEPLKPLIGKISEKAGVTHD